MQRDLFLLRRGSHDSGVYPIFFGLLRLGFLFFFPSVSYFIGGELPAYKVVAEK